MTDLPTYVLERTFDAPRALVWRAWTDPELLARWYGPGVETIIHKLKVAAGGEWLCEMRWGENQNYQRVDYTEVVEPEKLVWLQSVTDENWAPVDNPMMPNWPQVLLTTVTFADAGDKTHMRLTWVPHDASQQEIDAFDQALANLDRGWAAGMDIIAEILAELQA
ncbi:MAG: SRPBCC domain-containing protein [Boseongicola sp.]|nr:MAG: SRPBCC domain-containing protein [Boseongicola sp.]